MARPRLPVPSVVIGLTLHLRPGEDDDLLAFFARIPPRQRAAALKSALRAGGMAQAEFAEAPGDGELGEALFDSGLLF